MSLVLRFAAGSHKGLIREGNEDSGYAGPRLLAVADGMGGAAAGEVASSEVLGSIVRLDEDVPGADLLTLLGEAVQGANDRLRQMVEEDPQLEGMGCTLTAMLWTGQRMGMVHIGDSRAYLLRDGSLTQITQDHTWVQRLVDEGRITPEEAETHPQRSLLMRALDGRGQVEPDLSIREVRAGDRYLICSDGLVDEVSDEDIARIITVAPDPQTAADALVAAANEAGGRDNISVVVVEILASDGHRSSDDVVPATTQATPTTEPLGGWLPHDLAHGFDADADTEPPAGVGGSAGASAAAAAAPPAATTKRKRRLVTGRTIVFTSLVVGVFVVAFVVIAAFGRHGYYVGFQDDAVVVFQGRPEGVLWFEPTVESVSEVTRTELTPEFQSRIAGHPTFASSVAARRYVEQLAENQRALVADTTTTTAAAPATSAPSTSAVPASSVVTGAP